MSNPCHNDEDSNQPCQDQELLVVEDLATVPPQPFEQTQSAELVVLAPSSLMLDPFNHQQPLNNVVPTKPNPWRINATILLHVFTHAMLASIVGGAVIVLTNKLYLYEFNTYNSVNHNVSFASLPQAERLKYHCIVVEIRIIAFTVLAFVLLVSMLRMYDRCHVVYGLIFCASSAVLKSFVYYYLELYVPQYQFHSIFVSLGVIGWFAVVCNAAKSGGKECVKRIALTGVTFVLASGYSAAITTTKSLNTSPLFRWVSPFVIPFAAFGIRYCGQRSELSESSISQLSTTISVLSSIITRISQCAYLTNSNDFTMFLVMELFYDAVGVVIRVTLYHRQMITDTIISGEFWKDGKLQFRLIHQTPRSRLISSLCVAHGMVIEYISFIVMFVTRASLMPSKDLHVGVLLGVCVVCSVLQMVCCLVTHVLIRKVEAVPMEELDIAILPLNRMWFSQVYYIANVVFFGFLNFPFMYQSWFSIQMIT